MHTVKTYERSEDAHFDDLVTLFISLASINTAVTCYANRGISNDPKNPENAIHIGGRIATYSFHTHDLMHGISSDSWPDRIQVFRFGRECPPEYRTGSRDVYNSGMQELVGRVVGSAFLRYYEWKLSGARLSLPQNPREWPEVWRFSWLIRNAIAHGDRFAIDDPNFPETNWREFAVAPADSGRKWFDLDAVLLGGGDVLELLEELEAFDLSEARYRAG